VPAPINTPPVEAKSNMYKSYDQKSAPTSQNQNSSSYGKQILKSQKMKNDKPIIVKKT
jgi:hypothetical protein